MRLLKRITPGLDIKAIADEVRARVTEELDYELEAPTSERSRASTAVTHSSQSPT